MNVSDTAEYRAYCHAKGRCTNPRESKWKYYGGRGIEFRFKNFAEFIAEVGPRPNPKMQLDRIDNEGHYEIGNIQWTTKSKQIINRRRFRNIPEILALHAKGWRQCDIARHLGIDPSSVNHGIHRTVQNERYK